MGRYTVTTAPDRDGEEDHVDGCVCDLEIADQEVTLDEELPATQGGVQSINQQSAGGEDIDGCDVEFTEHDATPDEELPAAVGGVA
jgi:hypothetical protein